MPVDIEVPADVRSMWNEMNNDVVKYPEAVLRGVARPVTRIDDETRALAERMKHAMLDANGVGLAAPQVGVSQRLIVYRLPEEGAPVHAIVNPKIISRKGEQIGIEGCLSLPMLNGDVSRAFEIVVKGQDLQGRSIRRRATDMEARVIQHETDHLDGILFIDCVDLDTLRWYLPTDDDDESVSTEEDQPTDTEKALS